MRAPHAFALAFALAACGRSTLLDESLSVAASSSASASSAASGTGATSATATSTATSSSSSGAGGAGVGGSGSGGCDTPEVCDGIDNDCDGSTDEAGALGCFTFFKDADGDGWGLAADSQCLCAPSATYSARQTEDCNDASSSVHPFATEVCNGIDDDCNAIVDDGFILCGCTQATFGGHIYLFCPEHATWDEAQTTCSGVGFHLVSIADAAEDDFVNTTLNTISNEKWWMGLNDKTTEGAFVWEDGSPVTYTNWESNEPNNAGGNEDCAQLNRFFPQDTWNDEACTNALSYVCESP